MNFFSAADLQRKHELEGAPDPFPATKVDDKLSVGTGYKSAATGNGNGHSWNNAPDTESEMVFPSLGPTTPISGGASYDKPALSSWGAAPKIQSAVSKQSMFSDSFTLAIGDLGVGRNGKPITMGDIMRSAMTRHKVKVEASSNQKLKQTTFQIKSESSSELEKAKRFIVSSLSPVVTTILNAPATTVPFIIGVKGATLKQIRDQTNVKVDIPPRDSIVSTASANGNGTPIRSTPVPPADEEEDEPMVPITLSGPQPMVLEAREILNNIISQRTANSTMRVKQIPAHILPFLISLRPQFIAAAGEADVQLGLKRDEREISVSGPREAVIAVMANIKATMEFYKNDLTSDTTSLPKKNHRLLMGLQVAEDILLKTKCCISLPPYEDPSEEITLWGNENNIQSAWAEVMQKANLQHIHEYPVPGTTASSRQIVAYMERVKYTDTLKEKWPEVLVYMPNQTALASNQVLTIDLVGDKAKVTEAVASLSKFMGALLGATREVKADWLIHGVVQAKYKQQIDEFESKNHVHVFFPPESSEESSILLVYDPDASQSTKERKSNLESVLKAVTNMVKDVGPVKTELFAVEKKWHSVVSNKVQDTTQPEQGLSVRYGTEVGTGSQDVIQVRGASADVDRIVQFIKDTVEEAKREEIENSYFVEFEISREFVGRVVGSGGSGVNRLRDTYGVKIDFTDDPEDREREREKEKEKDSKKKKTQAAPPVQKAKVKVTGKKAKVDEAKKEILTFVERLADETTEILSIPAELHPSLIGQGGKYVTRLEDKYGVKITFPRGASHDHDEGGGKTREPLKPNQVLLKGGRKGVAAAKSELLDAADFEKENNHTVKFEVPTRSVARIMGRAGASINAIKEDSGAQIDVEKGGDDNSVTVITCRGTKESIAAAKKEILAIAETVHEQVTVTISIDNTLHRTIIGAGGQGLHALIQKCGGPTDPKAQAGLIRFPRQGEPSDDVRLRGEPALVKKLEAELLATVTAIRDRVVLIVEVPHPQHRALIGRGGQNLNDLQSRTGAQIQFPGSRSYASVGDAANAADFAESDPQDLVKVFGSKEACDKAIKELVASIKPPAPEGLTAVVPVPLKYQHAVVQQGSIFRTLRSAGVQVSQSINASKQHTPPIPPPQPSSEARIDDAEEDPANAGPQWQVVANYQDAEEGDSEWTLKAQDQDSLDQAQKIIADAIEHAKKAAFVGFLTLTDRSSFPRIVGTKGSTLARLRGETGTDITVGRDDNTIIITGDESSIEAAKEAILRISSQRNRRND